MRYSVVFILLSIFPLKSFGFFPASSVATSERAQSIFTNPAGLSIQPGEEFWVKVSIDSSGEMTGWKTSFTLRSLGLGVSSNKNDTLFKIAQALKVKRGIHLGYGIQWINKRPLWDMGFLLRPTPWMSLGGVLTHIKRGEKPTYKLGLGIRPLTDHLTLYGETSFAPLEKIKDAAYSFGLGIEPIDGMVISLHYIKGSEWKAGFDLSLGKFLLSSSGDKNKSTSFEFLASKRPYRTKFFKKDKSVEFILSGSYPEESPALLLGPKKPSFYRLIYNLRELERDPKVKGILIKWNNPTLSFAQMEELRSAFQGLKEKGKKIVVFGNEIGGIGYFGASAANELIVSPSSTFLILGLRSEVMFFKGTMDKLGIEADMARVGKYKSAVEPLTRNNMSEAYREQVSDLLDDLFGVYVKGIAEGRNLSRDSVRKLIDKGAFTTREALEAGLIDTILYEDDLDSLIKREFGKKTVRISFKKWKEEIPFKVSWYEKKPKIALIIAEGSIATGRSSNNPLTGKTMGAETIAKAIRRARKDKSVKAIVMRVNSPGGSGLASDIIWNEVNIAKKEKPFVVSMGNVAASGGYYISMAADKIIADRGTITGSIGVIGGKLVLRDFYKKIGINKEIIKRGTHADAFSDWRSFTPKEKKRFQELIDYFYWDFVKKVAKGRRKSKDEIHQIAQGRVWSGIKAKKLGLVDTTGDLLLAIACAKKLGGIPKDEEIDIEKLPRKRGIIEMLKGGRENWLVSPTLEDLPKPLRQSGEELRILEMFEKEAIIPLMPFKIIIK